MGNLNAVKKVIDSNIYQNGNQDITGRRLNNVLNQLVVASEKDIAEKQDAITDLDQIRAGAAKGATALQSVPSEYVTDSELSAKGYATTTQVAEKQDKINDLDSIRSGASKGATAIQEVKTINGQSIVGSGDIEIQGGGGKVNVDTELSETSENPIANKAVSLALKEVHEGFEAYDNAFEMIGEVLDNKQDKISDLDAIRSGAALGATALQSVPAGYVTTTDLQTEIDLVELQIAGVASAIPTKISQLNNDSGLATEEYVNQQVRNSIISALNTEV